MTENSLEQIAKGHRKEAIFFDRNGCEIHTKKSDNYDFLDEKVTLYAGKSPRTITYRQLFRELKRKNKEYETWLRDYLVGMGDPQSEQGGSMRFPW